MATGNALHEHDADAGHAYGISGQYGIYWSAYAWICRSFQAIDYAGLKAPFFYKSEILETQMTVKSLRHACDFDKNSIAICFYSKPKVIMREK